MLSSSSVVLVSYCVRTRIRDFVCSSIFGVSPSINT